MNNPAKQSAAQKLRRRNLAVLLGLVAWIVLIFIVTIIKLSVSVHG